MENSNSNTWRYFKVGDIIRDAEDSVWGNKTFEICSLIGNEYLPIAHSHILGKPKTNINMCNLLISRIRLVGSPVRKFSKLNKIALMKLMQKNNLEAKREFMIRLNNKQK